MSVVVELQYPIETKPVPTTVKQVYMLSPHCKEEIVEGMYEELEY